MQTSTSCLLVHDDWTELLVVPDEDNLFTPKNQRNHTFRLSSLCALVNEDGPEFEFRKPWIASTNASTADDVRVCQNFTLGGASEMFELLLVLRRQLS
ncbi:hypothetical protein Q9L58_003014 [Maublancomyces gigas]|uniref:Uncharacterized protein n=1 Tax=Discina gigas TaxID=1032678 RepID=A0ABR3GPS7_9PEZI